MSDTIIDNSDDIEDNAFLTDMTDEDIKEITTALRAGDEEQVHTLIEDLTTAETVELLEKIVADDRETLVEKYLDNFDPETFAQLDDSVRKETLESMDAKTVAAIVSELDSDDAVNMLYNLEPVFQKEIIKYLSSKNRATIEEGLTFEEDSAGRLMQREFVAIPQFWTVGKTIDYLRAAADELPEEFFDLFIIDPVYRVLGQLPLNRLIRSKRSERIEDLIAEQDIHLIPATMDQEDVARIFKREALASAPVIDASNRLIGVITVDDIVDVIVEEAQEDILRMSGVTSEGTDMYHDVLRTTKSRFAWLCINLVTAMLVTRVINLFDHTIEQLVALAVMMPVVASMGGNAGTQTLAIAVRALATRDLSSTNMVRMISKEALVGLANGVMFAVLAAAITYLLFQNTLLSAVIGMAMVINLFVAGLFGICIPIVLDKLKIDPALASSVFVTTLTDVIGFFAFLGLAALIML